MQIVKLILIILGIAVIGSVSYFALIAFNRYIDTLALNGCADDYRQTIVKDENTTVYRPLEQQVRECAWQKGVKNWNGVWSDLIKK